MLKNKKFFFIEKSPWKIITCIVMFLFGVGVIVGLIISSFTPMEQQIIEGEYVSYREEHTITTHSRRIYLLLKVSDDELKEFDISSIVIVSFDEENFSKNVKKGDLIRLIVDDTTILSIESAGVTYLNLNTSLEKYDNNVVVGYGLGGAFILVSLIAFSTLVKTRRAKYRRRR